MNFLFETYGDTLLGFVGAIGVIGIATYFIMNGPLAVKIMESITIYL